MTLFVVGWLVAWYALTLERGIRRSNRNMMSGSVWAALKLRERHSWRWWLWTLACRPRLWLDTNGGGGLWWPWKRVWRDGDQPGPRLPRWLFPEHMRRSAAAHGHRLD